MRGFRATKIEVELPENVVRELARRGAVSSKGPCAVAADLWRRAVEDGESDGGELIEARPDWVAALERGALDIAAGRVVEQEDIVA